MDNKGNPPAYSEPSQQWLQGQMTSPVQNQYAYSAQTNNQYPGQANMGFTPQAPYPAVMQHTSSEVIVTATANPIYAVGVPPDYSTQAWLACLCCFWPTGLIAISRANESRDALARGDIAGAHQAANHARQMIRISYLVGFLSVVLVIVIVIIEVSTAASTYDYDYDD